MRKFGMTLLFVGLLAACTAIDEDALPVEDTPPPVILEEPREDEVVDNYEDGVDVLEEPVDNTETIAAATDYQEALRGFAILGEEFTPHVPAGSREVVVHYSVADFEAIGNWDGIVSSLIEGLSHFQHVKGDGYRLVLENPLSGLLYLIIESDGSIYDFTSTFTETRVKEVLKSWLGADWEFSVDIADRLVEVYSTEEALTEEVGPTIGLLLGAVNDLELTFGYPIVLHWRRLQDSELFVSIEQNEVVYSSLESSLGDAGAEG